MTFKNKAFPKWPDLIEKTFEYTNKIQTTFVTNFNNGTIIKSLVLNNK